MSKHLKQKGIDSYSKYIGYSGDNEESSDTEVKNNDIEENQHKPSKPKTKSKKAWHQPPIKITNTKKKQKLGEFMNELPSQQAIQEVWEESKSKTISIDSNINVNAYTEEKSNNHKSLLENDEQQEHFYTNIKLNGVSWSSNNFNHAIYNDAEKYLEAFNRYHTINQIKEEAKRLTIKEGTMDSIKYLVDEISKEKAHNLYLNSQISLEQYKWLKTEIEKKEKLEEVKYSSINTVLWDKPNQKDDAKPKQIRKRKTKWAPETTLDDFFKRAITSGLTKHEVHSEGPKIYTNPFVKIQKPKDFKMKKKDVELICKNTKNEELKKLLMDDIKQKHRKIVKKSLPVIPSENEGIDDSKNDQVKVNNARDENYDSIDELLKLC